jgi:hypothetical protein
MQVTLVTIGAVLVALAILDLVVEVSPVKISWREAPKTWQRIACAVIGAIFIALGWLNPFGQEKLIALQLQSYYREEPRDGCFSSDEQGSNLVFKGRLVVEDLVSCKYTGGAESPERVYFFDVPQFADDRRIVEFQGEFGVDEAGDVMHSGAEAVWAVYQGREQLCTVHATWHRPGQCEIPKPARLRPDEPLRITETLVRRGVDNRDDLYLGIAGPRLVIR